MNTRHRIAWRGLVLVTALAVLAASGCVRRKLTITTEPEGARVVLNDQDIGTSPVTVDFVWYGDYDVIVRHDDYETLKTSHRLDPPWYQVPPFDFFAEVLLPATITDEQAMHFVLEPRQPIDREELVQEAMDFRERTLFGDD